MFEDHNTGDDHDHDHVPSPDADALDHSGADTFAEQPLPPLGVLAGHADASPDLHFPGDDSASNVDVASDLDPTAPWPDDGDFDQWLAGSEDTSAAGGPPEPLPAPEDSDGLRSADHLVDWTLRRLAEEG